MSENSIPDMTFEDALDEVHTRFILNLPPGELSSPDRIFFQLEQAYWFYDDFLCDNQAHLPRFKNLKPFARKMFEISPLLVKNMSKFDSMWHEFSNYKREISTYGCALLNENMDKVVLCQTYGGKKVWCFPMGKINQGENGLEAAARETYEETGFDPLVHGTLEEKNCIRYEEGGVKLRTLYIFEGAPEDFPYEPVARKEVSNVKFQHLNDISNLKTFAVNPFLPRLKKWIKKKKPKPTSGNGNSNSRSSSRAHSRPKSRGSRRSRSGSGGSVVKDGDNIVTTGLASPGDLSRWSEDDMFRVNEELIGKKIEYSGNPHEFSDNSIDPHRFHIVGGAFLNSNEVNLAPTPQVSKLQPLFCTNTVPSNFDEDINLRPYFDSDGKTPWEDNKNVAMTNSDKGGSILDALKKESKKLERKPVMLASGSGTDALFLTDSEITAKSQVNKRADTYPDTKSDNEISDLKKWVLSLHRPPPTELFGEFKFDLDEIMKAAFTHASCR